MTVSQREQAITLSVAIAMCAAFAFFLYLPRAKALGEVQQREDYLRAGIARINQASEEQPRLYRQVGELEAKYDDLAMQIPAGDHTAILEDSLWHLGKKHKLFGSGEERRRNKFFVRRASEQDGRISIKGATLTFTADFPTFYAYLKDLEVMKELTEVDRIVFRPTREGDGVFDITVDLSYFYGSLADN